MRMTHVSSGLTTTHAWTSVPVSAASLPSTGPTSKGNRTPMARPPPAAAVPTMKLRRVRPAALMRVFLSFMSDLLPAGGHVHRGPDALIRAAPADIRHGLVDVPVGRVRRLLQERRCRHDLAGLAVAALWYVERRPGSLYGMRAGGRQAFDGEDLVAGLQPSHGNGARANELAVDVHRAGAALGDAAAVLGARQTHLLADDPQQGRVGFHRHLTDLAVDVELRHEHPPPRLRLSYRRSDRRPDRATVKADSPRLTRAAPGRHSLARGWL